MMADEETQTEVRALLDRVAKTFGDRDIDGFLACFAPDPDVVMIGTGADETGTGTEEIGELIKRAWSQSESASLRFGRTLISAAGSVAWITADASVKAQVGGRDLAEDLRFTIVLEKRADTWLIVQTHDSLPAAGQAQGQAWATGSR
jgi:uncharacterized protein (TIGR02246 family)